MYFYRKDLKKKWKQKQFAASVQQWYKKISFFLENDDLKIEN
jgi:hypothetical protein